VRKAVHLYRERGLDGFEGTIGSVGRRGRPRIPTQTADRIVGLLREAVAGGKTLSYRTVAKRCKVSFRTVATVAKKAGLDPKGRRGQVAPIRAPSPTPKIASPASNSTIV
jgi:hypothetical protein